jgi:hypothetical protein
VKRREKQETELLTLIAESLDGIYRALARLADTVAKMAMKREPQPPAKPPDAGEQSKREKADGLPK